MRDDLTQAIQPGRTLLRQLEEAGILVPESPTQVVSRLFRHAGVYPQPKLVVGQCENKFAETTAQALAEGKSDKVAKHLGRLAYCAAMPPVSGAANIRDFIACVTYAMAVDILPGREGTRLLYAAQVASTTRTNRCKKRGKSSP